MKKIGEQVNPFTDKYQKFICVLLDNTDVAGNLFFTCNQIVLI